MPCHRISRLVWLELQNRYMHKAVSVQRCGPWRRCVGEGGVMGGTHKNSRKGLVKVTAAKMREMILANEPDAPLGSLREMSKGLGVGIVTIQQAARVLEHEGLLQVRRGPGGGYYGTRPDEAALGRLISGFLLVHRSQYHEAIDIVTLLDCEMLPAAALCRDDS